MIQQPKRPGIVMVAAILLLIFGIYGTIQGFCSLGSLLAGSFFANMVPPPVVAPQPAPEKGPAAPAAPAGFNQADFGAFLAKEEPSYMIVESSASIVRLLLGIGAIVAGAGVMKLKPSARVLGMTVALSNLILVLVYNTYALVYILPPTNRFFDQQAKMMMGPAPGPPPIDLAGIMKGLMGGILIFGAIFSTAIWLTVFLLLRSQKSRDAFAGKLVEETAEMLPREERSASAYAGYDDEDPPLPPLPKPPPPGTPPETGIKDVPGSP